MRGDPKEIARMHWKSTLKHYKHISGINNELNDMKALVSLIQKDYGESLFPHTSLDTLWIKPMHRYDANCDELLLSYQNAHFKIEYILKQSKKREVAIETSEEVDMVYGRVKPLLDRLLASLNESSG